MFPHVENAENFERTNVTGMLEVNHGRVGVECDIECDSGGVHVSSFGSAKSPASSNIQASLRSTFASCGTSSGVAAHCLASAVAAASTRRLEAA